MDGFDLFWIVAYLYLRKGVLEGKIHCSPHSSNKWKSWNEVIISVWKVELKIIVRRPLLLWSRGMHINSLHMIWKMFSNLSQFKDSDSEFFRLPKLQCLCWVDFQEEMFNSFDTQNVQKISVFTHPIVTSRRALGERLRISCKENIYKCLFHFCIASKYMMKEHTGF